MFLFLLTIITSINSWIQKPWVFIKSTRLKNFLNSISKSIIVRKKLILLLILYLNIYEEVKPKKKLLDSENFKFSAFLLFAGWTNMGKYYKT